MRLLRIWLIRRHAEGRVKSGERKMTGVERFEGDAKVRNGSRRAALAALVGGAMLTGLARPATAHPTLALS